MKKDISLVRNKLKYALLVSFTITAALVFLCFKLSVFSSFNPVSYSSTMDITGSYNSGSRFVKCYASKLYYTGYDLMEFNKVKAHYYYSLEDNKCTIYLISSDLVSEYINKAKLSHETPYTLENFTFKAALKNNSSDLEPLLKYISNDLDWNYDGIAKYSNTIIISEYDYNPFFYIGIIAATGICLVATGVITFIYLNRKLHSH